MIIRHITFSDENMTISANECVKSALFNGCNMARQYHPSDFDKRFFKKNKEILLHARGAGYWLWKPYIIRHMLEFYGDTDESTIIVYTDAGILFENDISNLILAMDGDIMLFGNRWKHGDWCKMDCLEAMGCNKPEFTEHEQLQASCIIVKNTATAREFIDEWLTWCQVPGMIDDSPSIMPNLQGFREHRHDQAILTNLALLHGITFHWWPAQYSMRYKANYRDKYPVMFQHHRKRNNEW